MVLKTYIVFFSLLDGVRTRELPLQLNQITAAVRFNREQVCGEIEDCVKTGIWVGDCFIYTNAVNRLNYYVGGEIVTIAHLDRFVR